MIVFLPDEQRTPYIMHNDDTTSFVIYCRRCHHGLCQNVQTGTGNVRSSVTNVVAVDPCPVCMEAARTGQEPEVWPYPEKYKEAFRE